MSSATAEMKAAETMSKEWDRVRARIAEKTKKRAREGTHSRTRTAGDQTVARDTRNLAWAYAELGLQSGSITEACAKEAYRQRAKETHPDRRTANQQQVTSDEAFKRLSLAYEAVLADLGTKR